MHYYDIDWSLDMRLSHLFMMFALVPMVIANPAWAFNWGFVRAPDWMDKWLILLLLAQAPFWLVAIRHKPRGVSLIAMDKSNLSAFAKLSIYMVLILFFITMMMVFIGMGLARMG
ncbi:hypothetical protein [Aliiroseovarius crassostreae]|uniref:hypothetical protein n=1 Tax=Aliiroseovarius crassostreae TaxID=154981 RepID=UPI002208D9DF|nr:hypothetical protein [Aliiroseovarius crassostreae]UWQ08253.1 hypothetical protein K3X25_01225 [Aliiroseovarius crassostreae]